MKKVIHSSKTTLTFVRKVIRLTLNGIKNSMSAQHTFLITAPQQRELKYFSMAICLITGGERFAYVQGFIPKKRWVKLLGLLKRRLYLSLKSNMYIPLTGSLRLCVIAFNKGNSHNA